MCSHKELYYHIIKSTFAKTWIEFTAFVVSDRVAFVVDFIVVFSGVRAEKDVELTLEFGN